MRVTITVKLSVRQATLVIKVSARQTVVNPNPVLTARWRIHVWKKPAIRLSGVSTNMYVEVNHTNLPFLQAEEATEESMAIKMIPFDHLLYFTFEFVFKGLQ